MSAHLNFPQCSGRRPPFHRLRVQSLSRGCLPSVSLYVNRQAQRPAATPGTGFAHP